MLGLSLYNRSMKVHLVQADLAWEDRPENHRRLTSLVHSAQPDAGDLILLPEMCDSGFSANTPVTADFAGDTLKFVQTLASDTRATVVAGRTRPGEGGGKPRNVASVAGPDGARCEYTKIHPFPLGQEVQAFTPGDEIVLFEWNGMKVAPVICYDLRFPELFRHGLQKGAECFALIACWPTVRLAHWRALCIARAIENQAFVFACNRTGEEPGINYSGGSLIVSPTGDVLAEGSAGSEVVSAEIDVGVLRRWRDKFPAWKDHRLLSR